MTSSPKLIHEVIPVGWLQCNCSIVGDTESREAIVIDPGDSPEDGARALIGKLPAIRSLLAEDVEAAFEGDPAAKSFAEIVVSYPSIRSIAIYRIAHEL
ncbi:MAG: hypothetical protein IH793_05355, partial [Acidobacteria bacterium]|nr:hypothetical protein [Acidobacteriota bacterium]